MLYHLSELFAHSAPQVGIVAEDSVVISSRGVERLRAGHLWVYRSDVRSAAAEAGAIVRLTDERGRFQGRAFYSDKSQIAVRLLTREDVPVDRAFFTERIRHAAAYRKMVVENTETYRLIYGEADLLPSLIVDVYGDYFVIQTLSQSSERNKKLICEILVELFSPKGILERNDPKVRLLEGLEQRVNVLYGEIPDEIVAKENDIAFLYDLRNGQKTGSFFDQRENHGLRGDTPRAKSSIASAIREDLLSPSRPLRPRRRRRYGAGSLKGRTPQSGSELHFKHHFSRGKYIRFA